MDKTLLKSINFLIKDLGNFDYIIKVRYIIFSITKFLYQLKINKSLNHTTFFGNESSNIFNDHALSLNDSEAEQKVIEWIKLNIENFDLNNFSPARLYEELLTATEKKNLGQVYTPDEIIHKMYNCVFSHKKLDASIKILDPSCGGGYFLVEAFKIIKNLNIADDKYIVEHMLYGVDIDDFSIFMTKASLLFAMDAPCNLKYNIYKLDYLTDDLGIKDIDVIIGNPPYVGHKNSSFAYKKTLYELYNDVFYDKSDVSYCFFKKSKELLKEDGIVSFITSRYFMEALYGDRIRDYIKNNFKILSLVDYSGIKVFKCAMVSAAVVTLLNSGGNNSAFEFVKYDDGEKEGFSYKQDKLKNTGWIILRDQEENLFNKIEAVSNTCIKDICNISQGIITGLDEAFVIEEKDIEKYDIERELLKKWIKNSNISQSEIKYNSLYVIYTSDIDCEERFPNAVKYLSTYKNRLEKRRECQKGYKKWYELQWGRVKSDFENPKIVFPYKSKGNNFFYDTSEYFCSADVYLMNGFNSSVSLDYLLPYLNSSLFEFYFKCVAKKVGTNLYEYYPNKLNNAKIYLPQENIQHNFSQLGKFSIALYQKKMFNITEEEVNIIYKYCKGWWRILKKFNKLLFLFTIFIVLSIQPASAKTVYYDTYNHWAASDIDYASNTLKVFRGYGDFTFKPENNITRAEFITILAKTAYRQNQMDEIYTSNMDYKDMTNKHWSYTFVISMYEHLKTNPDYSFKDIFPGTNFNPDKPITREESTALIAVFCKKAIYDNPLDFKDVSTTNPFSNEIERLYNAGIISGYEDNTFRGNNNITRAESAALIKRVYLDIKTSDTTKYLTKLEFLPIKGEDMYLYFGNYNYNTSNAQDKKYIKAKDTLEYVSFGGYIFPEDRHLYDMNAVDTMNSLRLEGYYNVTGTNFYLITFGDYSDTEKAELSNEILANVIARNDLRDSELMQIFTMVSKYNVKEHLYIGALEKWDNLTTNDNAKANILFFRYAYYIKNNNKEMLKTLVYDDLKKSNNIPSLLDINWGLTTGSETDFRNYTFSSYSFSLYKDTTFYRYTLSPILSVNNNAKVVELVNMLLVEKNEKPSTKNLANYEAIFQKYSLNRLYVLNFIGEKERAFVEGINDYNIIKTFNIYKTNKSVIDDTYTGILKKVK